MFVRFVWILWFVPLLIWVVSAAFGAQVAYVDGAGGLLGLGREIASRPPKSNPPTLEPKRGVALEDFPNSLWAGAEAVPDTKIQQNQNNKKTKFHGECGDSFAFLDFCFSLDFWFLHSKTKKQQQSKTPKLSPHSP